MTTLNINGSKGSGNQSFKQVEKDTWSSIYLPAICACILMTIVLFLAVSCSKKSDSAAKISAPSAPTATNPEPSTTAAAAVPEKPKKVAKKHRPANATYVNGTYGVSLSYPVKYSLQAGTKNTASAVQNSFLKPGAVQIAAVDMPDDAYPDTDFSSALLNVSVNTGLTAEQCNAFTPDPRDPKPKPETVKLGANEFAAVEQMSSEPNHDSDLKYYHLFKNGACYEFALDVETSREADAEVAQTDRGKAFKQLEKILASARIKGVEIPGVATAQRPAETTIISTDSKVVDNGTEKAQVLTPGEQK
jgi:hypothetical protein